MHRLLSWFILTFLFVFMLVSLSFQMTVNYERREDKRLLNLLGMDIVNHFSIEELAFDEMACMQSLVSLDKTNNLAGMLILKDGLLLGLRRDLTYTSFYDLREEPMSKRPSYVNRLLNELLREDLKAAMIEIAVNEKEKLYFNELDDNITIFLISSSKSYINVAGFKILF